MVSEQGIARGALVVSLCGLGVLLVLEYLTALPIVSISDLNKVSLGNTVKVGGRILWKHETRQAIIFELENKASVRSVLFSPTKDSARLIVPNERVWVIGKYSQYRGKDQIIVEGVQAWSPS